jgi:hypothetical protein
MTKKPAKIEVKETEGYWGGPEGSLVNIITDLQSKLDEGWSGIEIEYEEFGGGPEYYFYKYRPETDKEYAKRMKGLEKKKEQELKAKERRRKQYEKLRKEFGND